MNYLAHIYLSGDEDDLLKIGNFAADSVLGNNYTHLPERLQQGIMLHRHIDTFTDAHPIFRSTKDLLRPRFNHYSGIIVDMFYDHFLATYWSEYHSTPLEIYVQNFYDLLMKNRKHLPERTKNFLPYMIAGNWLLSYKTVTGLQGILEQMNRRTMNRGKLHLSIKELEDNYAMIGKQFRKFFQELTKYAATERGKLQQS